MGSMKNILTALLLSITILSFGQSTMNIYQNDGTTVNLPINTVDSFNYVTVPTLGIVLNIFETGGGVIPKLVTNIDSTTFTIPELPTLNTLTVNVAGTLATTGGNIINDGGASITARGIVWGTNSNPSLSSNIGQTNDGIGVGIFNSDLTGLTANTTYYVKAYATNSVGTAYGNELSFTTTTPLAIGDSFQGGIIFHLSGSGGLIAATGIYEDYGSWGCWATEISGADGTAIGTGPQNTIDIEAGCFTSTSAAAKCSNLNIDGYSDWFLPSKDELNLMYQNIGPGNALGVNLGAPGGFYSLPKVFWSSSEDSAYGAAAHIFNDTGGIQLGNAGKTVNYYIRAVRAF